VESSASIADVKDLITEIDGIPADQQRLVYAGLSGSQLLEDNRTLADYKVREGSTFHLVLKLSGC
jgi:large subunit ribosomal protein L40e